MSEPLRASLCIVGGKQVGKRALVEDYICKYFNGHKTSDDGAKLDEYTATIMTNAGPISLEVTVMRDIKDNTVKKYDTFIIVSDVTDHNMHTMYIKWHSDLTYCFGYKVFIVNCFNKTDIHSVPTYVFESSAPAFDISAKTTSGINDMLTCILRTALNQERLLICM